MGRSILGAAAVTLAVGALTACGGANGGTADPTSTTTPAPDPTSSPTPTSTPEPSPTPQAGPLAAVTGEGEVVLVDLETGEELEVLLDGIDVTDRTANSIAMAPDGQTVFVTRPSRQVGEDEVVRVPVEGGDPEVVGNGRAPAVSPDGETLAYVAVENGTVPEPTIVLQELDSGEETVLRSEDQGAYAYIGELTWSADGEELAFMAGEIVTGIQVIDADAEALDEARNLGPAGGETSWSASAAMGEGRLAVVAVQGDPIDPDAWTVQVVDLETGEVLDEPLPRDRVEARAIDARAGEPGLLIVESGGPEGGALLHWDGEEELRELTDGIITAAW